MTRSYFDTTALVKNYHAESGTPQAQALLATPGSESFISRLAAVEIRCGFAGADVWRMTIRPLRVPNARDQLAGTCIGKHAISRQLRPRRDSTGRRDPFPSRFPLDHFVCVDQRLCEVARLEGLSVIRP